MNASSESGLWATRMVRGMGPRRRTERRKGGRTERGSGGGLVRRLPLGRAVRLLPEFIDRRLVLLVLRAARGALGGEVGLEVALGLTLAAGVLLEAGDGAAVGVPEQVTGVANPDGVGQRQGAWGLADLHALHRGVVPGIGIG